MGNPVYAQRHAGNNGNAAGRKATRHVFGHRAAMFGGLARTNHGKARRLQQGKIAPAIEQQGRVDNRAQQHGIFRVCPQNYGGGKIAGAIPFFSGGDTPRTRSQFGGLPLVDARLMPEFTRLDGGIGRTKVPRKARCRTRTQPTAMPQCKTGPVFLAGGLVHCSQSFTGLVHAATAVWPSAAAKPILPGQAARPGKSRRF